MDEAVRYNRYLIDLLEGWASPGDRILDFGAGNGRFAIAMRESGNEVHAVEADPGLREEITRGGVIAHASLAEVGERELDGIYTINVLEHIEDDRNVLEGFHAQLRPGGRLLVYVPAFEILFSANDRRVGHVRRYRLRELVAKIEAAGFVADSAAYVDCIGFAAALAYRFFGDRDGGLDVRSVRFYDRFLFPLSRTLDRVFGRFFGKNLLVVATRPTG